jgi:large subunit ribosomal protein L32
MPVPAKRRSSSKGRRNRAHQAVEKIALAKCPKCSKAIQPHHACLFCGSFKGKPAIKIKSKKLKTKEKKA